LRNEKFQVLIDKIKERISRIKQLNDLYNIPFEIIEARHIELVNQDLREKIEVNRIPLIHDPEDDYYPFNVSYGFREFLLSYFEGLSQWIDKIVRELCVDRDDAEKYHIFMAAYDFDVMDWRDWCDSPIFQKEFFDTRLIRFEDGTFFCIVEIDGLERTIKKIGGIDEYYALIESFGTQKRIKEIVDDIFAFEEVMGWDDEIQNLLRKVKLDLFNWPLSLLIRKLEAVRLENKDLGVLIRSLVTLLERRIVEKRRIRRVRRSRVNEVVAIAG